MCSIAHTALVHSIEELCCLFIRLISNQALERSFNLILFSSVTCPRVMKTKFLVSILVNICKVVVQPETAP